MTRHAKAVKKKRKGCSYYVRLVRPYRIVQFCGKKPRGYWGPYDKRMAKKVRRRLYGGGF